MLDERDGRKVAKSLGLKVTGILGILLRAQDAGEASALRQVMDALRTQAGFRIGATLYDELLQRSGEK